MIYQLFFKVPPHDMFLSDARIGNKGNTKC